MRQNRNQQLVDKAVELTQTEQQNEREPKKWRYPKGPLGQHPVKECLLYGDSRRRWDKREKGTEKLLEEMVIKTSLIWGRKQIPRKQCRGLRSYQFDPWVRKIPWRRKWQPTLVFLPGKFHGQRSLAGSMGSQSRIWLSTQSSPRGI